MILQKIEPVKDRWYTKYIQPGHERDLDLEQACPDSPYIPESYREYERQELLKEPSERWTPPAGRRLASEFYGKHPEETAFVIGTGPSVERAKRLLQEIPQGAVRIGINRAIDYLPAEYWMWIDAEAYFKWRDLPNVAHAKTVGVDRWEPLYKDDVYVWRRAYELPDFRDGRLTHRSTSLLPALHFAVWLGCTRIVTVGCDNQLTGEEAPELKDFHSRLFERVHWGLTRDRKFWCPSWVTLLDASRGALPLPPTTINAELERLNGRSIRLAD